MDAGRGRLRINVYHRPIEESEHLNAKKMSGK